MAELDFPLLKELFPRKKKPVVHELKWKLPEERLTAPLEDAEATIAKLKKAKAVFKFGGEFTESIFFKEAQGAQGVFSYYIIRTDKKTEREQVLFDGYMLMEEEKLGIQLSSSFSFRKNLQEMGYREAFSRELTLWSFSYLSISCTVFSVAGMGDFLEIALPQTKIVKNRELHEKQAQGLLKTLGIQENQAIPTDLITLQLVSMMQQAQQQGGQQPGPQTQDSTQQAQATQQPQSGKPASKPSRFGGDFNL
jgi:adenylate cyclase class IV